MSVRNFLRRQVDANGSSSAKINCDKTEVESRPLSEYDNLTNFDRSNFPLVDIKFRFDDLSSSTTISNMMNNNSSNFSAPMHNNNETKTITTSSSSQQPAAHHQYENVLDTLQQRSNNNHHHTANRESNNNTNDDDQQVKMMSQNNTEDYSPRSSSSSYTQRPVMSDAKSSFFGINSSTTPSRSKAAEDELDRLIEDIGNATINTTNISNESHNQYVNFPTSTDDTKTTQSDKTPSASGSSSTTATPSATPTRQDKIGSSRKNSESSSSRSKSPKFMLPEMSNGTPSQVIYMSTTVPQNIKGQNIMGRHKPTRQSLRHSRMIVHTTSSKSYQGSSANYNTLNIKYVWFARFVLTMKIFIGISILVLGAWICLFANSTPIQQNPFWAGLILLISGLLGLYLLKFRRIRSKLKAKFFWFLKANAAVIIILSVFSTTLALIYASFHYISLSSDNKRCFPDSVIEHGTSCICIFDLYPEKSLSSGVEKVESHTDSSGLIQIPENTGNVVHFKDISCSEIPTWTHILLTSMILNLIGLSLAVCFMTQFIFGCKRRRKQYINVRSDA